MVKYRIGYMRQCFWLLLLLSLFYVLFGDMALLSHQVAQSRPELADLLLLWKPFPHMGSVTQTLFRSLVF